MIFDYNVIYEALPLYFSGLLTTLKLLALSLFFGLLAALPLAQINAQDGAAAAGDLANGKLVFENSVCGACHRTSRPASRGTAYSISRNTTRRSVVKTRCATSV